METSIPIDKTHICVLCKGDLSSSAKLAGHTILVNYIKYKVETSPEEFKNCSHSYCYERGLTQGSRIHRGLMIAQTAQFVREAIEKGQFVVINDLWDQFCFKAREMCLDRILDGMCKNKFRAIIEKQMNDGKQIAISKRFYIQNNVREMDIDTCAAISYVATRLNDDMQNSLLSKGNDHFKTPESVQVFLDGFNDYSDSEGIIHPKRIVECRLNQKFDNDKRYVLTLFVCLINKLRKTHLKSVFIMYAKIVISCAN